VPYLSQIYDGFIAVEYDGAMSHRWPLVAVVSLLSLVTSGCKKREAKHPIVVHLFRDLYSPYAHELDHRILEYQSGNPHLPSGAPIVLETVNEQDYKNALKNDFEKNVRADVVILNNSNDVEESPALAAELANAVNVCAAVKACPAKVPAFVPPTATGEYAAAAHAFLDYLAKQQ